MNIDIVPIPRAKSVDDPLNPLWDAYVSVSRAHELDLVGNDDLAADPRAMQISAATTKRADVEFYVAFPEGDRNPSSAIGTASAQYQTEANTHLAEVNIIVRPDMRSRGVGKALLSTISDSIKKSGRKTIATWTEMRPYEGDDGLIPKSGVGRIDPKSPAALWLTELGFELEQIGKRNMLELPRDADKWWLHVGDQLAADLEQAGPDYELLTWRGRVPLERREQMALLRTRMSTDEPTAGMDYQEDKWDAERIRDADDRAEQGGWVTQTSAVRHVPTDQLVAYSELVWLAKKPAPVHQEDTFVLAEHRGHRLGAVVKIANLQALLDVNPDARRIYTWNAGENRFMLAINDQLGFKVVAVEGSWQKRL